MIRLSSQRSLRRATTATVGSNRGRGWRRYKASTFYIFAAPWILGFIFLTIAPMGFALGASFTNYDGMSPIWRFVGLRNYIEFFTDDPEAWASLFRTLSYAAIAVTLSVSGALALAILVNRRIRARGVIRAIFFLPSVVPVVAVAIMWRLIFNRDAGLLNGIIELLGGPEKIAWLSDPLAFYTLVVLTVWGLGGGMIIILAALQNVPAELEEAARIDGASPLRVVWNVTIPMISPILYFQVITGVIASLQILVQPMLLAETNGMALSSNIPDSTTLFMVQVYNEFFLFHRFGYGTAMLWIFLIFILLLTLVLQRLSKKFVYYEVEVEDD